MQNGRRRIGITIDKALDANPDFKKAYDEEPGKPKKSSTLHASIEGNVRGEGVHAVRLLFAATPWPTMFP